MRLKDLLSQAGDRIHAIGKDDCVDKALRLMTGHGISAVIVTGNGQPVGIFTERDLLKCHVIFTGKQVSDIPVREVMTSDLIVARPDDEIKAAMGMMIAAGIRHLPVVRDGAVVTVLALEDLVKHHVGALTQELHYLKEYISDLQDAAQD